MPIVYAHRGGAALRPENTVAAFDHGMACGADGLEFDVHLSRDQVVVIHHDRTLERTTNGRGALKRLDAAELSRLDAAYNFTDAHGKFPYRGQGIGVPLLSDVLRRYPTARLIIEMKEPGERLVEGVIAELRAAGALGRVAIGSFYPEALGAVRRLEPSIPTGAGKAEIRRALLRSWAGMPIQPEGYREFQVPIRSGLTPVITRRFVKAARRAGVPVKVWTVNDEATLRRLVSMGVEGVITDRPDLARAIVDAGSVA